MSPKTRTDINHSGAWNNIADITKLVLWEETVNQHIFYCFLAVRLHQGLSSLNAVIKSKKIWYCCQGAAYVYWIFVKGLLAIGLRKELRLLIVMYFYAGLLILHYNDVIISATASQITSLTIIYSIIQAQIKENIKAPRYWSFVRGIHQLLVNSPHKGPVTRKIFSFDYVIMLSEYMRIGKFHVVCQQCSVFMTQPWNMGGFITSNNPEFQYILLEQHLHKAECQPAMPVWCMAEQLPDSKVHGANMRPTCVLLAPCRPHEPCY